MNDEELEGRKWHMKSGVINFISVHFTNGVLQQQ